MKIQMLQSLSGGISSKDQLGLKEWLKKFQRKKVMNISRVEARVFRLIFSHQISLDQSMVLINFLKKRIYLMNNTKMT